MVGLMNVYLFIRSNPKINCWLGVISRDSKDVLFVLICNNCDFFYTGQTEELKQRMLIHKSNVIHPNKSNCKNVQNICKLA